MRILFINLPYHGHVIPTIGLVQELIKAGHQVTYLMPYDWEERIAGSGAEFLGYENNPQLDKQIRNAFFKADEDNRALDREYLEKCKKFLPNKKIYMILKAEMLFSRYMLKIAQEKDEEKK